MIGVDLFSGAGGMSLGAVSAGVDVQQVVEADPHAAATYLANHTPKNGIFIDDIRKFKATKLKNRDNEGLVVFGGPPCQGFSTSNQRTRSSENINNWLFSGAALNCTICWRHMITTTDKPFSLCC